MTQAPASAPRAPTRAEAFRYWWRLGWISFGGPAGQIAIMHRELVEQKRWISERRFLHALNYCMVLPGPEAQQLATYIGWLMHRTWGGIAAGGLFVLPSLAILIALSWIYVAFGNLGWVAGLFHGIKPAVAAIVLQAVWRIGSRTLRHPAKVPLLWAIALASFVAIAWVKIPFPWVIAVAALVGTLGARFAPAQFATGGG
ncbi:MAG TPA: chromate transporter, partial [Dongiaceae bacterium]|nr:chromate transporter [Dongiaceae bacterium]